MVSMSTRCSEPEDVVRMYVPDITPVIDSTSSSVVLDIHRYYRNPTDFERGKSNTQCDCSDRGCGNKEDRKPEEVQRCLDMGHSFLRGARIRLRHVIPFSEVTPSGLHSDYYNFTSSTTECATRSRSFQIIRMLGYFAAPARMALNLSLVPDGVICA